MNFRLKDHIARSDSGLLFNTQTGESFYVNETGLMILEMLNDNLNSEQIVQQLADRFNTLDASICEHIDDFIEEMQAFQLLDSKTDFSIHHQR